MQPLQVSPTRAKELEVALPAHLSLTPTQAGLNMLGAGQSFVVATALPAEIGLYVAGMITDIAAVPATTMLRVAVLKEDESVLAGWTWKVEVDLADEIKHAPMVAPAIGFAAPLRFEVDKPGTYQVGVGLNDKPLGVLPLAIVLNRPMEDELQELL